MKKKLLAVAVVGALASPAAFAQNVTIYGGIDVGYQNASNYADGSTNHNFITSGGDYTSRIGFKGSDDIMAGTTALFVMESGISADTGGTDAAGFWQRQVYAGLDSKQWGALTVGRQYTHMFNQGGTGGYSTLTLAGWLNPEGFSGTSGGQLVRASNYVKYSSPNFSGVTFGLGYSPSARDAAEPTTGPTSDGRYWDGQVSWRSGPFAVAFAHNNEKADDGTDTGELKRNQITGKWDNGVFGVFGGYAKDQASGAGSPVFGGDADLKHYWIQPVFRFGGNNEVFGIWARAKLQPSGGDETKASWWGIAARHHMTKRTWVYAGYGTAKNDDGSNVAPTTFAAAVSDGRDPRGLQVGLATTF